jgi:hypothetical protein
LNAVERECKHVLSAPAADICRAKAIQRVRFSSAHKRKKVCACVLSVCERVTTVNAGKRLSCFDCCAAYLFLKSGESAPTALSRLSIDDESTSFDRYVYKITCEPMDDQMHILVYVVKPTF